MNWINVALIICVIILACLVVYLFWFMAHPRSEKQAQDEADEWARRHSLKDRQKASRDRRDQGGRA